MKKAAEAPAHRADFRGEELVVGDSRQGDTEVYVSEYTGNIQRSARKNMHFAGCSESLFWCS